MLERKNKILAVIPARGGSKGVKNKNIFNLGGYPLIYYSIKSAIESKFISRHVVSTDNFLVQLNNDIQPNNIELNNKFFNPNVLIAGCGTGQHLVHVIGYQNSNIVGVDLSLTSLAYAKRKIEETGYKNVEFLQGDILDLKNLNRKFDVIECGGVLHHMRKPLEGLKVLLELLEPHGYLKLGLYSELSRKHLVRVRDFIKEKNWAIQLRILEIVEKLL